jgi:hypothetical protein
MSAKLDTLRDYCANLERFIREWEVLHLFESTKYYDHGPELKTESFEWLHLR